MSSFPPNRFGAKTRLRRKLAKRARGYQFLPCWRAAWAATSSPNAVRRFRHVQIKAASTPTRFEIGRLSTGVKTGNSRPCELAPYSKNRASSHALTLTFQILRNRHATAAHEPRLETPGHCSATGDYLRKPVDGRSGVNKRRRQRHPRSTGQLQSAAAITHQADPGHERPSSAGMGND